MTRNQRIELLLAQIERMGANRPVLLDVVAKLRREVLPPPVPSPEGGDDPYPQWHAHDPRR